MSNFLKLCILFMIYISPLNGHPDDVTSNTTPATTASTVAVKVNSSGGFTVTSTRDGLTKRGAQVADLTESSATGKSYDPPPEFYRGPGSTSSSSYSNRDQQPAIASKPIAFPHNNVRQNYGQDDRNYASTNYNDNWKQQAGVGNSAPGRHPGQDRISVGHYVSAGHGVAGGGAYNNDYAYEARPYGTDSGVGGGAHATDYNLQAAQYAGSAHGGVGVGPSGGGGSDGGAGGGGTLYYSSAEVIPFDLYSHNGNKGHYAGAGGGYSYSQYPASEPDHAVQKGHHHNYSHQALLAKSFLIPLASAAVLGIAAALVSNPLLLQLGTVSGVAHALAGKRKRRALKAATEEQQKVQLAYRGHHAADELP